ncbi:hypothetical protein PC116_g2208 [Phytophthora cactorum]|nr:hypothetical protein PC114_g10170 [Phytophthora cactorum]KAG4250092.1 hypothetical protein PC116_g2208 [Phytophthora cactorum]
MCKGPPGFSARVMKVLSAIEDAAIRLTNDSGSSAASLCSLVLLPYYAGPLESSEESDRQVQMVNPRVLHISQRRQSKSVIEEIKADAKLILSNRKGSEGKPDVRALAKKHGCSRTAIRNVLNGKSTGNVRLGRPRQRCPDVATSRHLGSDSERFSSFQNKCHFFRFSVITSK